MKKTAVADAFKLARSGASTLQVSRSAGVNRYLGTTSVKLAQQSPIASCSHRREDTQTAALCNRDIVLQCT